MFMKTRGVSPAQHYEHNIYEALVPMAEEGLKTTPFYEVRDWEQSDIATVEGFLVRASSVAHKNLHPNFWEVTQLAALYAEAIAKHVELPELNPAAASALNLMHDFGRLISPDQYYRNDLLFDRFAVRTGFRSEELNKLPSLKSILTKPIKDSLVSIHTPTKRVLHIADWLGKRNTDGQLVTIDEIIDRSQQALFEYGEKACWPTAKIGHLALKQGGLERGEQLFKQEVEWLTTNFAVDILELRDEVDAAAHTSQAKAWLTSF